MSIWQAHKNSFEQTKDKIMARAISILFGAAIFTTILGGQSFAQTASPAAYLAKVEIASLATGYRTSKVVGTTVVNETNETVGHIDDLIITTVDKSPFAVLSVGGFLGIGTKYVVVSYSAFEAKDNKMVLRGATKESLHNLPEYKYPG